MTGPNVKKAGGVELFESIDQRKRLGDHDGDDDLPHAHCDCGWCIPDAIPIYFNTLPATPAELTDDFAIPGACCVLTCPRCGSPHVMSIGPKLPPPSEAN